MTKTANPTSLPEPGGPVIFTVRVNNTSAVDSDHPDTWWTAIHGNLNGQGTCSVPQTIPAGSFYQCTFNGHCQRQRRLYRNRYRDRDRRR